MFSSGPVSLLLKGHLYLTAGWANMPPLQQTSGGVLRHRFSLHLIYIIFRRKLLRAVEDHFRFAPPAVLRGVPLVFQGETMAFWADCRVHIVVTSVLKTETSVQILGLEPAGFALSYDDFSHVPIRHVNRFATI